MTTLFSLQPQLTVDPADRLRSPGEVLRQDYLEPSALSAPQLARKTGIAAPNIHRILLGERPIKTHEAVRLAIVLNTTALYWLVLQARFDLEREARQRDIALNERVPLTRARELIG